MSRRSQTEILDLPVLPLRDVVVFPHMVIPLFVGRDKSMRALEQAMEADKRIILLAQKSAETDDPAAADLYTVGTLAQVLQLLKLPDGTIKVLVEGTARIGVSNVVERDGSLYGQGEEIDSTDAREPREIEAVARSLMGLFEQYVKTNRKLPPELLQTLAGIDEPSRLADTIAAHLGVRLSDKQRLLETIEVGERLELLVGFVDGEIDVQQLEKRIRGRVKSQMEKSQREYYLNEQMKAIQKELGEGEDGGNELDEIVHAYACTIHKSQGSEYPAVVIVLATQHFKLLQRNLLYTAVTRARKLVCIVGSSKAIHLAIRNNEVRERRTTLAQRLKA